MDPSSTTRFEAEIARYNLWREELTRAVHAYHDWLEGNQQLDVQQSIRFYDLLENLNRGRLMLAFLAEFSRGKSELINALFMSAADPVFSRILLHSTGMFFSCEIDSSR